MLEWCVLWSWPAGAAAGCRCRVPLQGMLQVLLLEWCESCGAGPLQGVGCMLLQGAAVRVLVPLQGVAARCPWQCGALGPAGDYVYAVSTGECLVAAQEYPVLSGVYAE